MTVPDATVLLQHRGFVRALARGVLVQEDLVDDAEQETWLAAVTQPPPASGALRAWLGSIGRRRALDRRRREATRGRHERATPPAAEARSTADLVAAAELGRTLAAAVLALDAPLRDALLLRFYEALPPREVARRLEVPLDNARARIRRGLEALRRRLDADGEGRSRWLAVLAAGPDDGPTAPDAAPCARRPVVWGARVAATLLAATIAIVAVRPSRPAAAPTTTTTTTTTTQIVSRPAPALAGAASGRTAARVGPANGAPPPTTNGPGGDPPAAAPAPAPGGTPGAGTALARNLKVAVRGRGDVPIDGARVAWRPPGGAEATRATGPDGVANIEVVLGDPVMITVCAAGHATAATRIDRPEDLAGDRVEVTLDAGTPVRGVVVDARDGRPVAGVRLRSIHGGTLGARTDSSETFLTYGDARTGADGAFVFDGLPFGVIVTLVVSSPGWELARTAVRVAPGQLPAPVEVRVGPAGTVRVRVVTPDDRPIAGADVRALVDGLPAGLGGAWDEGATGASVRQGHGEAPRSDPAWLAPSLAATTGADGTATLCGVPFGAAGRLRATARGWRRSDDLVLPPPTAERPEAATVVRLRAPAHLWIRGVAPDGRAVGGLRFTVDGVQAHDAVPPDDPARPTVLADVAPGRHQVVVEADGFVPVELAVDVAEGAVVEHTVAFEVGAHVEGRVVGTDGRPLAGVPVYANEAADAGGPGRELGTTSDADGRFRIAGLRHGVHDVVAADDTLLDDAPRRVTAPASGVELVVRRRARYLLRVAVPPGAETPDTVHRIAIDADGSSSGQGGDWTEAIEFAVPPTTRRIRLTAAGYLPWERDVDPSPDTTTDLGRHVLDEGLTLEGVVVDRGGAPVEGATIDVSLTGPPDLAGAFERDDDVFVTVHAGADGRFRRPTYPRGKAWVVAAGEGFVATSVAVDGAGASAPLRIVLRHGGVLRVTATDAEGRPRVHHAVTVATVGDEAEPAPVGTTDATGRRDVRVPPGRYRVTVQADGGEPLTSAEVAVEDERTVEVSLRGG